jgi:hypothetical protein
MPLFYNPPVLTKEQQVAAAIDQQLRFAAQSMLNSYNNIRRLIYANNNFKDEYGNFDPDVIYAAFAVNTTTGLTAERLGQAAIAVKTMVNLFAPNTIQDAVPEATITFPS